MPAIVPSYLEIIDFIAGGTTPETVLAFKPSDIAQQRVDELMELHKADRLSPAEKSELDHCLQLEHILVLAKASARKKLAGV